MSAPPQLKVPFAYSPRPLRELELIRLVGNIAWNGSREDHAFDSLATVIVRLPGFIGFRFEPLEPLPHLPAYETIKPRPSAPEAFARAEVAANGRVWGEIKLFFDPSTATTVESPVRLTRFLGQQLGLMLNRLSANRERRKLLAHLEQIRRVIRRRKLIHSAAAVLSRRRKISGAEAISFIAEYAKHHRRPLLDVSELLILGCDSAIITRPLRLRMTSQESVVQMTSASRQRESVNVLSV